MPLPVPPFYIFLTNFGHYQVNNSVFKSDPFYSHAGGYKMVMIIRPNGFGKWQGNHVSLHVSLLPGEFDDQLRWPFYGRIAVQAYNCMTEKWSIEQVIVMNIINSPPVVSRCGDKLIEDGAGVNNFLPFTHLGEYISSANSLRIRIARIEIYMYSI